MADDKSTSSNTNQTQTQNSSGTQVVTPNTPAWLSSLYEDVGKQGQSLIDSPTTSTMYAPEKASTLQTTANNGAITLPSVGAGGLSDAIQKLTSVSNVTAPTISASKLDTSDIQRLMNPFVSSVVNASTGLFDKQAGLDQASLDAQAGMNAGAFGGSGYALQKSNLTGTQALDRSQLQSGLLSQGYDTAASEAGADADRAQAADTSNQSAQEQTLADQIQAAMGVGSLSAQQQAQAQAAVALQAQLGQTQQQQDTANQQFPLTLLQQIAALMSGIPVGALSGSTTQQNSSGTGTNVGSSNSNTFGVGTDLLPKISFVPG